jgi:hypothetical protein
VVTDRTKGAILEPIRASIEVRASIVEALRRWSDLATPVRPRQVDFESVASTESRVTVEAYAFLDADVVRRQLDRHLSSFKRLIEEIDGFGAGLP